MALFTSVGSGDFDAAATWDVGAGFPGAADTFAIVAGHTVTIPVGLTATSSGTLTGTGTGTRAVLVVNGTFQMTADTTCNAYNQIDLNTDAVLDLNGNDLLYSVNSANNNVLNFVGTANNRCKVKSTVAGGKIDQTVVTVERIPTKSIIEYCDFADCGVTRIGSEYANASIFSVRWTTFTRCGQADLGYWVRPGSQYIIEYVDFRDSKTATPYVAYIFNQVSGVPGTIRVRYITSDDGSGAGDGDKIRWDMNSIPRDHIYTKNIQHISQGDFVTNKTVTQSFYNYEGIAEGGGGIETHQDCYFFSASDNPHTFDKTARIITDCVVEATYTIASTDSGDHFISSASNDMTITGTILLDSRGGVLLNVLGFGSTGTIIARNNTIAGDFRSKSGLALNEASGYFNGTTDLHDNILYNKVTFAGSNGMNLQTAQDDQITNMDYNSYYDIDNHYTGCTSATKTPGVTVGYGGNDIADVDPNFVDGTRSLASWALIETGVGTAESAIDHMIKVNGYDSVTESQVVAEQSGADVADLLAYIRAGYTPTNAAYNNTGSTGTWIGAVEPIISAGGGTGTPEITALDYVNRTNYYIN